MAQPYQVETRALNQAVKRNGKRFPADFIFQLDALEFADLRSQNVTSSWGGRRTPPFAFTEHGAIMAAAVLNSDRAVEMSVYVVRAFVQLREVLSSHKALTQKLDELERRVTHHDNSLASIIDAIRALTAEPRSAKRPIGFTSDLGEKPA
ncbi:MAG: ORF6N domain-containing protein [Ramlibacter sp.]|nr:ORF6N domain-containing protein [Ramlibacter sp.]